MQFCRCIASIYPHMLTGFGRFNLIFNKLTLIFLVVLIIFTVSSFNKSDCLDFIANDEWPNSPNVNQLDYQVWGKCWSLNKSLTEAKTSSRVLKCTLVNLVCVTGDSHCMTTLWKTIISDCRYVSASGGHFEHLMS